MNSAAATLTVVNDRDLLSGFLNGTLESFPHEAHLRVVHLLVLERGEDAALATVTERIRAMAAAAGAATKFHMTRTTAWTRIVAAATAAGVTADSDEFLARHPELIRRDLLDDYYSAELLTSERARLEFVEPDRAPLPAVP